MKQLLGVGVTLAIVVCGCLIIWLLPPLLVEADGICTADRATAIAAARQTVLWALGGAIAIVGLYFTWRRDQVATRRAQLDRDANLTSRFTDAVSQLGNEKPAIRVGGVYALERIAMDSDRDRQTILDTLAAYVQDHGKRKPDAPAPVDVVAAASVIGRITQVSAPQHPTDLHQAHFMEANLKGANLAHADLSYADLRAATFEGANLSGIDAQRASGWKLNLSHASLRGANLRGASLGSAVFDYADLSEADFTGATLPGASFTGTNLASTRFPRSQLEVVLLSGKQLREIILVEDPIEYGHGSPK